MQATFPESSQSSIDSTSVVPGGGTMSAMAILRQLRRR